MGYDDARRYFARVVPWDGTHYVSVHYKRVGKHGQPTLYGTPYKTVDQAVYNLEWNLKKNTDLYLAMSSQNTATEKKTEKGRTWLSADRVITNSHHIKSLFLDVDVKPGQPGKAYPDTVSAKQAFKKFLVASGIPGPTVLVASGTGGFHAYWCLTESIDIARWRPLAASLVAMGRHFGLLFDGQCSIDCTRLLRIPQTFNYKPGGPYPVALMYMAEYDYFIEKLERVLSPYKSLVGSVTLGSNPSPDNSDDELSAGITRNKLPPSDIDQVAAVCPFVKRSLETGGRDNAQPLWHQLGRLATCCVDGKAVFHRLSSGWEGYLPEDVDEFYDRLVQERVDRPSIGPARCETIASAGAPECVTCPMRALGKTPLTLPGTINFAPVGVAKAALPGIMPDGYYRGEDGFIYSQELDEDTQQERRTCVFPYQIIDPWVEAGREYAFNFITVEEGNAFKPVRIPFISLADRNSSAKALAGEGLPMRVTERSQDFMTSFLRKLRDISGGIVRCEPVGWHLVKGEIEGFAYAGKLYTKAGERIAQSMEPSIRPNYSPTGNPDPWREAIAILNQQRRPALDALVLSAFSAPLIGFTGQSGVSLGGWSNESGVGKTTALQIALGAWGHPIRTGGGLNDTANATFHRAGLTRNLPLVWDEIKTQKQTSAFLETIFTMTSGKEKSRLNRSAKAAHQGEWQSILTYASNASMTDAIIEQTRSTTAGHVRVFEFQVPRVENVVTVSTMAGHIDKMRANYGHAGEVYAGYLGANFDTANKITNNIYEDFQDKLKIKEDERYWNAVMAATLAGGFISNRLGLTNVDLRLLKEWLRDEFERMRSDKNIAPNDFSKELNILNTLAQFLSEKRALNTLKTDNIPPGRGKPPPNSVIVLNEGSTAERLQEIHVQVAVNPKIIRIADYALTAWCKQEQIPKSAMVEGMKSKLSARWTNVRLGSGTRFSGMALPVWELLVAGTIIDSAVDW